ncbi:TetR family transcriptional regulator [Herbiconiux sp. L3-i23]|uniref:acyl-CoA-like ligand-binding transcription factor n=1 Tax=Herbiconiux sp. L3-i23 TaxID=2905871 RepID=UPI00206EB009|nr:TetR family transcriptional regulator [Herbiconiux sp. L3-i23]BDI22532.1 putative transcriptional regulatory protein TetR [Herbiconiux sp. L3-i23]
MPQQDAGAAHREAVDSFRGRPAATSRGEIERAAFVLFETYGFGDTTIAMIAAELGVSPRTVTRYFPSKNDIPWGAFDATLPRFHDILATTPDDLPLWARIHDGVLRFNEFPDDARPSHRARMSLIFSTPSLQAHSVLRNARWKAEIERFVVGQLGPEAEGSALPNVAGQVSMALATSAYEQWLASGAVANSDLIAIMNRSMSALRDYLRET